MKMNFPQKIRQHFEYTVEYAYKYAGLKIQTYRMFTSLKLALERFIITLKAWKRAGLTKPDEHAIAEIRGWDLEMKALFFRK